MARLTGASYAKIALIIVLGLGLFGLAGLGSCTAQHGGGEKEAGREMGNAQINAEGIKNICVNWAAGSAKISVTEEPGSAVELTETGWGLALAQEMRWSVSGDTLDISYGSWFPFAFFGGKDLEVRIPQSLAGSLGTVSIDGASGYYEVDGISCDALRVHLSSGEFASPRFAARECGIDLASGKARANGVVSEKLSTQVASGRIEMSLQETAPQSIKADMASGTTRIAVPENSGFTLRVDKASGSFESAFEVSMQGDNTYRYKDGSADYSASLASGNFALERS